MTSLTNLTDLQWLAATILLTLLGSFAYIVQRTLKFGLARAFGNPGSGDDAELAPWALRTKRAHANAIENLAVFAPALIAAHLANPNAAMLATAAQIYFFARLTHYVVYAAGVPVIRTLAYAVGIGATLVVLGTLLAGGS